MQSHHQGSQRHHQSWNASNLHEQRSANYSWDSGCPKRNASHKANAAGTTVAGTRCGINQIVAGKIAAGPLNGRQHLTW